ncbi:hypothetical protein L1887_21186 [Cichorium endivia]|nr:hypothetical protein L1887_21186 [Cichorium endivia]
MTKSIHNSFPAYEGIGIHSNPQQETSKLGIDVEGNVPDEIQYMVLNSLKSPPQLLLSVITYTQRLKSIIAKEIEKIDIRADAETLRRRLDGCRVKMMNQRLFSDEDDEPGTVFGYIKIVVKVRFSEGDVAIGYITLMFRHRRKFSGGNCLELATLLPPRNHHDLSAQRTRGMRIEPHIDTIDVKSVSTLR